MSHHNVPNPLFYLYQFWIIAWSENLTYLVGLNIQSFTNIVAASNIYIYILYSSRWVLVLMQSLSGSGHKFALRKSRALSDKQELYRFDPRGKRDHHIIFSIWEFSGKTYYFSVCVCVSKILAYSSEIN